MVAETLAQQLSAPCENLGKSEASRLVLRTLVSGPCHRFGPKVSQDRETFAGPSGREKVPGTEYDRINGSSTSYVRRTGRRVSRNTDWWTPGRNRCALTSSVARRELRRHAQARWLAPVRCVRQVFSAYPARQRPGPSGILSRRPLKDRQRGKHENITAFSDTQSPPCVRLRSACRRRYGRRCRGRAASCRKSCDTRSATASSDRACSVSTSTFQPSFTAS